MRVLGPMHRLRNLAERLNNKWIIERFVLGAS